MICIIAIEGVLALGTDLRRAQPTKWGRLLYDSLHTEYRMVGFTMNENELAKGWLKREMLKDWAAVLTQDDGIPNYQDWKLRQLEDFLAEAWDVGMFIDTDPVVIQRVTEMGILGITLTHPVHQVGFRPPEEAPRAWVDVVESL
jgi:hypothetical protein